METELLIPMCVLKDIQALYIYVGIYVGSCHANVQKVVAMDIYEVHDYTNNHKDQDSLIYNTTTIMAY